MYFNLELASIVVILVAFFVIAFVAGWWMKFQSRKKEAARKRRLQKRHVHFGKDVQGQMKVRDVDSAEGLMTQDQRSHAALAAQEAQYAAAEEARLAGERALIAPELALLKRIRSRPVAEVSFEDVRRLLTYDETDVDLVEHISNEDSDWLYDAYGQLVPAELERLVENAIEGSAEDYRRALALRNEALDFVSYDVEDHPELVNRWDRMIMRHVAKPEWDDILGWSEYDKNLPALYKNARNGDFFSIRLVLMLIEEGDEDVDLVRCIVGEFRETMTRALEAHSPSFTD